MAATSYIRRFSFMFIRFATVVVLAVLLASPINHENYDNFYTKTLFKLHTTNLGILSDQLTAQLSYLLFTNDTVALQDVLDSNFGLFGFVVTDCRLTEKACPDQRILYTSDPRLGWRKFPTVADLEKDPFAVLRGPTGAIGRLYPIRNIPRSFQEDYALWMTDPLRDAGVWRYYLKTLSFCLLGGLSLWMILELMLGIRRIQRRNTKLREEELVSNAANYLKLLEDKNQQLEEQDRFTTSQFETYFKRIRELELRVQGDVAYRNMTEELMKELEEGKQQQSLKFNIELQKTREEMQRLKDRVAQFEQASDKNRPESYKALEEAVKTQFSNAFEQKVYESVTNSAKYRRGDWLVIPNFDVAAGRNYTQFTDCIVISKECLVVIEAKNYPGTIDAEGDFENDPWFSCNGKKKEIVSVWGVNPFQQVDEYCRSLMYLIKRQSQLDTPVYGLVVFPEGADVSRTGGKLGRFYRITTVDHLVGVLENIEAEARRSHAFSRRPSPLQLENVVRGRKIKDI